MSMTMRDKNGREMKTGDVVRITGAYFKTDNGYYFIDRTPGDVSWFGIDYSLHKIRKNGTISTAKYSQAFWPLTAFCSDPRKNAAAKEHNREHAMIEIIDGIDKSDIIRHFEEEAAGEDKAAEYYTYNFGEESARAILARKSAECWRTIIRRIEGRERR